MAPKASTSTQGETCDQCDATIEGDSTPELVADGGVAIDEGVEPTRAPREMIKQLADERDVPVDEILIGSRKRDPMYRGTSGDRKKAEWFAELWRRAVEDREEDRVHVRGVHYATVMIDEDVEPPTRTGWDVYENTKKCYDYLVEASVVARILGEVPLDGVIDEKNDQTRFTEYDGHTTEAELEMFDPDPTAFRVPDVPRVDEEAELAVSDADHLIQKAARTYRRRGVEHRLGFDRDALDPYHVELWSEKTLPDEIHAIAEEKGVDVVVEGQGDLSYTVAADLVSRVEEAGKPAVILYLSDFDPKGDNMAAAMSAKLAWLEEQGRVPHRIVVDQLAITREQIEEYDLTRKPIDTSSDGSGAKAYDTLVSEWEERKGVGAVELNVLESRLDVFESIVRDGLEDLRDDRLDDLVADAWEEWREEFRENVREAFDEDEVSEHLEAFEEWADEFNDALEDAREHLEELAELTDESPTDDWEAYLSEVREELDVPELEPPETDAPLPADPLFDSRRGYLENSQRIEAHKRGEH